MTLKEAAERRKNWGNKPCNHISIARLAGTEASGTRFACEKCGTELDRDFNPEFFYREELAKLSHACYELINKETYIFKDETTVDNIEEKIAASSDLTNALIDQAVSVFLSVVERNVDVMVRAIDLIGRIVGPEVRYNPQAFRAVLETLITIAEIEEDSDIYAEDSWKFLFELGKGVDNYRSFNR